MAVFCVGRMMAVVIMPVMMNICQYQQSFIFSLPFWELLPSSTNLASLSSSLVKEKAKI